MIKRDAPHHFESLEAMIDKHGLSMVLKAISEICDEKAEHVHSAWQDEKLGKAWERASKHVWSCASSPKVRDLP